MVLWFMCSCFHVSINIYITFYIVLRLLKYTKHQVNRASQIYARLEARLESIQSLHVFLFGRQRAEIKISLSFFDDDELYVITMETA
jgi:hypothetical protein